MVPQSSLKLRAQPRLMLLPNVCGLNRSSGSFAAPAASSRLWQDQEGPGLYLGPATADQPVTLTSFRLVVRRLQGQTSGVRQNSLISACWLFQFLFFTPSFSPSVTSLSPHSLPSLDAAVFMFRIISSCSTAGINIVCCLRINRKE